MLYLTVKTLHIIAAIVWIGSLLLTTFLASAGPLKPAQLKIASRIVEAGIGLTWLAGIVLVVLGQWHTAHWWQVKIVLVVIISALHSINIRRLRQNSEQGVQINSAIPWALLMLASLVVALAVFKIF